MSETTKSCGVARRTRRRPAPPDDVDESGRAARRRLVNQLSERVRRALAELLADGVGQITRIGSSTGLLPQDSASLINDIQRAVVEQTLRFYISVLLPRGVGGFTAALTSPRRSVSPARTPSRRRGRRRHSSSDARGRRAFSCSPRCSSGPRPRWGRVEETYGESLNCAHASGSRMSRASDLRPSGGTRPHFLGYATSMGG
jgi:hypothetical protein